MFVDGCICFLGIFLDDISICVFVEVCFCYFRGFVVVLGEVVYDDGVVW